MKLLKWVRKHVEWAEHTYTLYLMAYLVNSSGLLLDTENKFKFRQTHHTVPRVMREYILAIFFVFIAQQVPLPLPLSYLTGIPSTSLPVTQLTLAWTA
jgi:hypothetical protein